MFIYNTISSQCTILLHGSVQYYYKSMYNTWTINSHCTILL